MQSAFLVSVFEMHGEIKDRRKHRGIKKNLPIMQKYLVNKLLDGHGIPLIGPFCWTLQLRRQSNLPHIN